MTLFQKLFYCKQAKQLLQANNQIDKAIKQSKAILQSTYKPDSGNKWIDSIFSNYDSSLSYNNLKK